MNHERVSLDAFREPPRECGILPFWFLNGELDPDEMRFQLKELADKGMAGVILHGRFGLEMPYIGERYLDRIRFAVEEAGELGLKTWIYDEMNWPSGTADKRVLAERPDLAQRFLECIGFEITGPWFMCLTGGDSRYLDFERSTPVAAFAVGENGRVIDLTRNLSFENVVPWEVPAGRWRLMYVVEKRADYYIDALDPEATETFLRIGYQPYLDAIGPEASSKIVGFYSDEPAMHYYLTGSDNAIVPWTKDMLRRFQERNRYDLRPRLPDLFLDVSADAARVRHDFYETLTEFYSRAYYGQIQEWCGRNGVQFTAHLLYEEWLRRMIRVEGNLFRHYERMDVVAVDHLYPVIGTREAPDQHVAIKVASSAAHQVGSGRLICESFGGIFLDATMQRMKWIADWEYVLGVNVLNPHGFHYTFEGARKRDWPPSMFYQYPWWHYYGEFSSYMSRLSQMLTGGRHVAKVAVLWPINAMYATYTPQERNEIGDRIERDFNVLTDLLLRMHYDFDYLDEDVLGNAAVLNGTIQVRDEVFELVILPPMAHIKRATLDRLEEFVRGGGHVLGAVFAPTTAFGPDGLEDVSDRVSDLFAIDAADVLRSYASMAGCEIVWSEHDGGGRTAFLRASALAEATGDGRMSARIREAIDSLIDADVRIENDELFCLHRVKDGRDIYFVVNPTFEPQEALVTIPGEVEPVVWDPASGEEHAGPIPRHGNGTTSFVLRLPAVGSTFVVPVPVRSAAGAGQRDGKRAAKRTTDASDQLVLDGSWEFEPLDPNALVIGSWLARPEEPSMVVAAITSGDADERSWGSVGPGAWAHQVPGGLDVGFPWPVWYRIEIDVEDVPPSADLVIDGFSAEGYEVFVNGTRLTESPVRSPFDSQMKTVPIAHLLGVGGNVLAIRLVLRGSTDGLVDLVKVIGDFSVAGDDGSRRLVRRRSSIDPGPWTEQGYPFYSGRGRYRRRFDLPASLKGEVVVLETPMGDDVLEVAVNGSPAGVRLWDPYAVEVTDQLRAEENVLELTVANTPANMIGGTVRPSGIAGPPRLVVRAAPEMERIRAEVSDEGGGRG